MADAREAYEHLSYFYSDVFDLSFSVLGRPVLGDDVVFVGELDADRSIVLCSQADRLIGVVLLNANDRLETCRSLLREACMLEEAFGGAYRDYMKRVRRWI